MGPPVSPAPVSSRTTEPGPGGPCAPMSPVSPCGPWAPVAPAEARSCQSAPGGGWPSTGLFTAT